MSEYRIDIKIRNNLLLQAVKRKGYDSIPKFCKDHGISYTDLNRFISMKASIYNKKGDYKKAILKVSEALGEPIFNLFTENQALGCKENKKSIEVSEKAIQTFLEQTTLKQLTIDIINYCLYDC